MRKDITHIFLILIGWLVYGLIDWLVCGSISGSEGELLSIPCTDCSS